MVLCLMRLHKPVKTVQQPSTPTSPTQSRVPASPTSLGALPFSLDPWLLDLSVTSLQLGQRPTQETDYSCEDTPCLPIIR